MKLFEAWLEKECSAEQAAPVLEQTRNVLVTAGAGSGKTRTLVARYLYLLLRYQDPRRIAAITFSDKAAEEMRVRTRSGILSLISTTNDPSIITELRDLYSKLDSARIGTIHGLCMEILLNDPAKAAIDPASTVLEEVQAGILKLAIIKETFAEITDDPRFDQVFINFNTRKLGKIFQFMLDKRLQIKDVLPTLEPVSRPAREFFDKLFSDQSLMNGIDELASLTDEELEGVKRLFEGRETVKCWQEAKRLNEAGDPAGTARMIHLMRYTHLRVLPRTVKPASKTFKNFRDNLDPYIEELGFSGPNPGFNPLPEVEYELVREGLMSIFEILNTKYENALRQRQAIDFDAMEDLAVRLLRDPEVKAAWQAKIDALMVDEFQDTNGRQREIVIALTEDRPGKLFVVGDARQSIYRFRQADVSVFRRMLRDTEQQFGRVLEMNTSYRTHEKLLNAVGNLLGPIMGTEPDPENDHRIHFTPLNAFKLSPDERTDEPFVEIIVAGEKTWVSKSLSIPKRFSMANALAERLIKARREEEIHSWGDVAVLCRTTNSYEYYEDAFDEAGIPFVTSSGKGFLNRPEVRDLLNVLRGLSDPTDDLVMAGLLRSPMFGLSDAALFHLRPRDGSHFFDHLSGDMSALSAVDAERSQWTLACLRGLLGHVDRLSVADLIKKVVDNTHYTAILAAANIESRSQRQWRNIGKLIENARESGTILLRDYLELIDNYEDVGVDLGEAPSEAEDAVKLMTIHASKGLEFPWVVLGEASRTKNPPLKVPVLFDKKTGLAFKTERYGLHFQFCKNQEKFENLAEMDRLLYVALTRAKDKLIINGAITMLEGGKLARNNWLGDISEALNDTFTNPSKTIWLRDSSYFISCTNPNYAPRWNSGELDGSQILPVQSEMLLGSLIDEKPAEEEEEQPAVRVGSVIHTPRDMIRKTEGALAHKAIELGLDPSDDRFATFAKSFMYSAGISDRVVIAKMVERTRALLVRYNHQPIAEAVREAERKHHELRYTIPGNGFANTGIIDLLVKLPEGWVILDFKTDEISTDEELDGLLETYRPQLQRYKAALYNIMKINAVPKICFLDDRGEVTVHVV